MQKFLLPVRALKLSRLKGGSIGSRRETCVNCGGLIAMLPCLHRGHIYTKTKVWVWRDQKCILLLGAKTPLTSVGRKTTPSQVSRYRPENRDLHKFGWTDRHGTVFAPRQFLNQKEATGMESPEMYFTSWCKNPS